MLLIPIPNYYFPLNIVWRSVGLDFTKTLQRTNETAAMQDNLTYGYKSNNQLDRVADAVATPTLAGDIENQAAGNYVYDAIGQLTENVGEKTKYRYNTQGLVTEVQYNNQAVVRFFYNERGQRIKKESYSTASPYTLQSTDYYALDLSGNVMAIYNKLGTGAIAQQELPIFGTGRLGVYKRVDGSCSYQITDHLGNVRAVVQKGNSQPISVTDYYPFGEQLPSRTNGNDLYRYAFQGQELDKETGMEAFQLRLWDGRIGRWLSVDPAGEFYSPYLGMGNNPIGLTDPTGATTDCCGPGEGTSTGNIQYSDENGNPTGVDKPATNLAQVVIIGPPKSTAYKVADTLTDFVPVVGGAKDIYKGWKNGNPWQVAMGVGFIAFDLATLGGGSLVRGGIKTVGKELLEGGAKNFVYHSVEGGVTRYVGITNNLARRTAEHLAKKGINIKPLLEVSSRADARAVEQALIKIHGLGKNGGTLKNMINSIAKSSPNYASQLERGFELLNKAGYKY